jgi:hypothetical protein
VPTTPETVSILESLTMTGAQKQGASIYSKEAASRTRFQMVSVVALSEYSSSFPGTKREEAMMEVFYEVFFTEETDMYQECTFLMGAKRKRGTNTMLTYSGAAIWKMPTVSCDSQLPGGNLL